jgi:hypothetical protein
MKLLPTKLELVVPVLEVYIVDGVSRVSAPITRLVALEAGAPTLREAHFRTEGFGATWC